MNLSEARRVFNVDETATEQMLTARYRTLARLHHPDMAGDSTCMTDFATINTAYVVLREEARRLIVAPVESTDASPRDAWLYTRLRQYTAPVTEGLLIDLYL